MAIDLLTERSRKVAGVAQRLRMVQAELADQPADIRRSHLKDEVDRVLKGLVPGERKEFVSALMKSFPDLGSDGGTVPEPVAAPAPAGPDRASLETIEKLKAELVQARNELARAQAPWSDPMALAERLAELGPKLGDDAKRSVVRRLSSAGLIDVKLASGSAAPATHPPASQPASQPASRPASEPAPKSAPATSASGTPVGGHAGAEMRRLLGLGEHDVVDPARVGDVAFLLADFSSALDDFVWQAWREKIAPQSKLSRPGSIRRTLGAYLKGDAGAPRTRLSDDLGLLRKVTLASLAAIARAGKGYARKHLSKYGVDAIVTATGSGGWGKEAKYWAKYVELCGSATEESMEAEIMQTIGEHARGLAEGTAGAAR